MISPKLHVDLQWLNRVSVNLKRFKKVRTDVYNCSCPSCGDGTKKSMKFYFFVKKGSLIAYCHKCLYSSSFYRFMETFNPHVFDEYKRETLMDVFKKRETETVELGVASKAALEEMSKPVEMLTIGDLERQLPKLTDLPRNHVAVEYLTRRGFKEEQLRRLYFADCFYSLASKIDPVSTEGMRKGEPRIVIPFLSSDGKIEMVQGRSLNPNDKIKYLSIKAHEDIDKIYGKYELDPTKTSYCVEGPLDSLFVQNCVATCDANLTRSTADVLIWDNQCRNKQIVDAMARAIDEGRTVVVWPNSTNEKQDINDMIQLGMTSKMLMKVIEKRSFSGLMAKAQLMKWKRV